MPAYRISTAARLLGVSDDTLRRRIARDTIELAQDAAGHAVIDGVELVRLALDDAPEPGRESSTSARNHFEGLVTRVVSDQVMSQVELQCGTFRVVALISTESVNELGLEPGVAATARVKATNVVVDRADR